MKIEIVRANAIMNYLIRQIEVICENPSEKCGFHYFLHDLMEIFVYENNSLIKKRKVRLLMKKIMLKDEYVTVKDF